ncbi:hypothetical protein [Chitinivibrio alkaliphilus]|uniref:hypothetical protein n=1 Tax=Chitinivibrio alkaliphilus TaxID=1505232 RepID=UPI0012DC8CD1|nr:hypothetical protein [Chitinivibrio alkaliphilus]
MGRFKGKATIPSRFLFQHMVPALIEDLHRLNLLRFPYRRYVRSYGNEKKAPVSQISLRVNEVCNLRCDSCGQWGENGHLRMKQERGESLQQLDLTTVKRIILETKRDRPVYYIWGGEPTLWKPLLPFLRNWENSASMVPLSRMGRI